MSVLHDISDEQSSDNHFVHGYEAQNVTLFFRLQILHIIFVSCVTATQLVALIIIRQNHSSSASNSAYCHTYICSVVCLTVICHTCGVK